MCHPWVVHPRPAGWGPPIASCSSPPAWFTVVAAGPVAERRQHGRRGAWWLVALMALLPRCCRGRCWCCCRPTPLYRAHRLEKALQTPARIYYSQCPAPACWAC